MNAPTFTKTGAKATSSVKLSDDVFGKMPENHELLKQAYITYLANGRLNLATTKTRGEVRGGGKKPWRQKGTGRARVGSSRNPIWRSGGVAFGPTGKENYKMGLNVKAKRQAIRQALSLAVSEGKLKIIETFECKQGKVSQTVKLLSTLDAKGSVLLVVSDKDSLVNRATSNVAGLKVVQASYLNTYDLLNSDAVIMSEKALAVVTEWLSPKARAPKETVNE
jgi:large subunit ribosomal protein L4